MVEDLPQSYFLMCSACHTPCPSTEAHVIARWNPARQMMLTAYRCGGCWPAALVELRDVVASGQADIHEALCDFLARRGYDDVDTIRNSAPATRQAFLLKVVDAVEDGRIIFHP
jgi:hypothetical protein